MHSITFGGDLSFTDKEISFNGSAYQVACGIVNVSSPHLLATNHIPTVKFMFKTKLNYAKDLAKSEETIENFALSTATTYFAAKTNMYM